MIIDPKIGFNPAISPDLDSAKPLDAAMALASMGIPVFPVHSVDADGRCSCGSDCGRSSGKHPRTARGFLDATTNSSQITAWWRKWPQANLAIATGTVAGICVLDIDLAAGAEAALFALEDIHGQLEPTWCVETGGGGFHFWYVSPAGGMPSSAGAIGSGLDVRADGGYAIVPPSRHRSGERYCWSEGSHPRRLALAQLPPWLEELIRETSANKMIPPVPSLIGEAVGGNHLRVPPSIMEGQRNATLTSLAGAMRRGGFSETAITAALQVENAARCQPPLPEHEVDRIARSVARYAPATNVGRATVSRRSQGFVEFVDGRAVLR